MHAGRATITSGCTPRCWLESRSVAAEAYPLDTTILGLGVVESQADDVSRLVALEDLAQVGRRFYRFAFDIQNNVGTAVVRTGYVAIRGAARGDTGNQYSPLFRGEVELLGIVLVQRLHRYAEQIDRGRGGLVGRIPIIIAVGRTARDLSRRFHLLKRDLVGLPDSALTGHFDLDLLSGLPEADLLLQLPYVLHRLAIHADDDVAGLDAGLSGRGILRKVLDQDSADIRQADVFGIIGRGVLNAHSQRSTVNPAVGDDLVHHFVRQVDRDRKAVSGVEPGLAGDRRVDPDH